MNYRILKFQKLIRKDLKDLKYRVDPFHIAGIHTAILTILFAVVTTCTLLINERYQDLEAEVYKQAEQINKLFFLPTMYSPKKKIYSLSTKRNIELSNKSLLYCGDLNQIFFFGPHLPNHSLILPTGNPHPKDPLERAEIAVGLINIIGHSYPFPTTPLNMQIRKYGWSERQAEAITFKNLSDVREWLKDLQEINEVLLPTTYMTILYVDPEIIIKVFNPLIEENKEENKIMTEKKQILSRELCGERDPCIILNNFRENLKKSEGIAESVKISLKKFDNFKVNLPPERILTVGFAGIFVIFILGVILPMLRNRVNKFFQIWLPSIFYIIAYGYIFYFTIIKIKQN